jgi:hypothetical protein
VAFNQEGNGFAELHSANAGSPSNTLHDVTFTPIVPSTIKDQGAFLGFDGFLGRGQVDPLGAGWDGIVTLAVDLVNGTDFTITFAGDTKNDNIGSIGFDELNEPGFLVKSVSMQTRPARGTSSRSSTSQFLEQFRRFRSLRPG